MILVTKDEAKWLQTKGATFKKDLHKTYSGHSTYYLTEGTKYAKMLYKHRNESIILSVR